MNTDKIFIRDFANNLNSDLSNLERERKKTVMRILVALLPFSLILFIISGYLSYKWFQVGLNEFRNSDNDKEILLASFVGILAIFSVAVYQIYKRKIKVFKKYFNEGEYVKAYKKEVIGKMIPLLKEEMAYNSEDGISRNIFCESGFPMFKNPTSYHSSGSVSGKIGKTTFTLSEIWAKQLTESDQSKHEVDLFRGIFFVADFQKKMDWNTLVLPDFFKHFSSFLVGKFSNEKEFLNKNYLRVKLEDTEFERHFEVYGTDQVESRYVLSPPLMARIVDFKRKTNRSIQLSFKNSKVFFAIHYPKNKEVFLPPLFQSVYHFDALENYVADLKLMLDVIKELNINSNLA